MLKYENGRFYHAGEGYGISFSVPSGMLIETMNENMLGMWEGRECLLMYTPDKRYSVQLDIFDADLSAVEYLEQDYDPSDDLCLDYQMWPVRQNGLTGFAAKCCLKDICECELKYAFDLQQKVLGERPLMLISITSLWHRDIDSAMDNPLIRDFWESLRRERN